MTARIVGRVGVYLLAFVLVVLMSIDPGPTYGATPFSVTVKERTADAHQRAMIGRVLSECRRLGAPVKVRVAAVATITQESTARNLTGGHGTSVGLFQIIDIHGPVSQRRDPEWAARWFCSRAIRVDRQQPALSVGALSQAVQRSAHPHAYGRWVREASRTRAAYAQLGCA
jgi:hypothetical protein